MTVTTYSKSAVVETFHKNHPTRIRLRHFLQLMNMESVVKYIQATLCSAQSGAIELLKLNQRQLSCCILINKKSLKSGVTVKEN